MFSCDAAVMRALVVEDDVKLGAKLTLPDSVDEIHQLGSTLNEMPAGLEQAFEQERAFICYSLAAEPAERRVVVARPAAIETTSA